ncbi:Uncharacterised protein [Mycobacteroides abscessus subsp. abscessus]|nr:Uncharacterised protein [Mycobacteroides abscessus subsp. abscessus]
MRVPLDGGDVLNQSSSVAPRRGPSHRVLPHQRRQGLIVESADRGSAPESFEVRAIHVEEPMDDEVRRGLRADALFQRPRPEHMEHGPGSQVLQVTGDLRKQLGSLEGLQPTGERDAHPSVR